MGKIKAFYFMKIKKEKAQSFYTGAKKWATQ